MMIKLRYGVVILLTLMMGLVSCGKDDDSSDQPEPPRDRGPEAERAQEEIEAFLSTHFYNYEEFEADPDNFKIKFDTIAGENASKTPLIEQVEFKEVDDRSEEHTSELQSRPHLVCRLLLEKKKKRKKRN